MVRAGAGEAALRVAAVAVHAGAGVLALVDVRAVAPGVVWPTQKLLLQIDPLPPPTQPEALVTVAFEHAHLVVTDAVDTHVLEQAALVNIRAVLVHVLC